MLQGGFPRGDVSLRQLSAGCGEADLWQPLLLVQYCCQGGDSNIFVKTQLHKTSQLPVLASSGSKEDAIDMWRSPVSAPWMEMPCDGLTKADALGHYIGHDYIFEKTRRP